MFQKCHVCFFTSKLCLVSAWTFYPTFSSFRSQPHILLYQKVPTTPHDWVGYLVCTSIVSCAGIIVSTQKETKTQGLACPVLHIYKISDPKFKTPGFHHYFKVNSHMLNFTSIIMGLSVFMWLHSSIPLHIPHAQINFVFASAWEILIPCLRSSYRM